MEFTGYIDFWFTDRPMLQRVEAFAKLGIKRLDVWCWRLFDIAELAAECKRHGCVINSTFDDQMGSLVDPGDNELTYRTWNESLEMAARLGVEHLFIFSNQVDLVDGREWTRRLSRYVTEAEQYANLLAQTERILKLAEQTTVELWVEALNTYRIQGGVLVHDHDLAADWVRRFDHPQLRMAFDCFHQQLTAGNLINGMEKHIGLYPTFHIGDVPTRQEPGTGEINFPNLVAKLHEMNFDGMIGMEFYPSTDEALVFEGVKKMFLK